MKLMEKDAKNNPKKEPNMYSNKALNGSNLTKAEGQESFSRLLFKG